MSDNGPFDARDPAQELLDLSQERGDAWRARYRRLSAKHEWERKQLSDRQQGELLDAYREWRLGVR